MSDIDLSSKQIYDSLNNDQINIPTQTDNDNNNAVKRAEPSQPMFQFQKPKRSFIGFVIFVLIIAILAFCIYFTIYRLGWGVKECVNKKYTNCAALLSPELSQLALLGVGAMI